MARPNSVAGLRGSSLQSCRLFYKAGATVPPGRMAAGVQPEEEEAFLWVHARGATAVLPCKRSLAISARHLINRRVQDGSHENGRYW